VRDDYGAGKQNWTMIFICVDLVAWEIKFETLFDRFFGEKSGFWLAFREPIRFRDDILRT